MNSKSKYFKIFSECISVKGFRRAIIYDLPRGNYQYIPIGLYYILKIFEGKDINKVKEAYGYKQNEIIDEYFDFLIKYDYVFFCDSDEVKLFPKLSLKWDYSSLITNTILEINHNKDLNYYRDIITKIEKLNCRDILIKFNKLCEISFIKKILNLLANSRIKFIELFIAYNEKIRLNEITALFDDYLRVMKIVVFNYLSNNILNKSKNIIGIKNNIDFNIHHRVNINNNNFNVNMAFFTESQKHNSYFNRKLFIDIDGNIKNAPELQVIHGNIQTTKIQQLKKIIKSSLFQKYWFASKDETLICRDCEHRYMCVDSRPPIGIKNEPFWEHIKECPYNPYIAKWQGQEGYITVEQWQKENPNWEQQAKEQRQTTY